MHPSPCKKCRGIYKQYELQQNKSLPAKGTERNDMKNSVYKTYDELPLMLSVSQVADVLGIGRTNAYELVKEKDFPSLKIGSRIVIPRDKLIQWIEEKVSEKR